MNINLVLFLSLNDRRNADHRHETNEYFLLSLAKKFKLMWKGLKKKIKAIWRKGLLLELLLDLGISSFSISRENIKKSIYLFYYFFSLFPQVISVNPNCTFWFEKRKEINIDLNEWFISIFQPVLSLSFGLWLKYSIINHCPV